MMDNEWPDNVRYNDVSGGVFAVAVTTLLKSYAKMHRFCSFAKNVHK